jgi:arylsulfatase A-like enzyme
LRIPAIVRWPGRIAPGSECEQVCMSMDWMPTFVSMAGGRVDSNYPSDGLDLTGAFTGDSPASRKVFWRYHANSQRAMRDGHMKYLKINDNEFLFDVIKDPLERANLFRKQPDVFARMQREHEEWNAQMLSDDDVRNAYGFYPQQLADHYNPTRPTLRRQVDRQPFQQ